MSKARARVLGWPILLWVAGSHLVMTVVSAVLVAELCMGDRPDAPLCPALWSTIGLLGGEPLSLCLGGFPHIGAFTLLLLGANSLLVGAIVLAIVKGVSYVRAKGDGGGSSMSEDERMSIAIADDTAHRERTRMDWQESGYETDTNGRED